MAWLLAAVVEPHDFPHTQPTTAAAAAAAGGGGSGGSGGGGENANQGENEEQELVVVEDGLEGYDAADSGDSSHERPAGGETLAKKLATRKRTASFLHQLLITVIL